MAFKKVEAKSTGLKVLVYGGMDTGKSWFSQTFPKIGVVDGELSQAFDVGREIIIDGKSYNNVVFVDDTLDLDELEEDLDAVIDGEVDIDTFVIDGETKFYQVMELGAEEVEEKKAKDSGKNVDARAKWGRVKLINMKLQQAKITTSAKGCHIVSIAQEVEITEEVKIGKKTEQRVVGYRPDANKKLGHDYDIILRFVVEKTKDGQITDRYAIVDRDRTHVTQVGSKLHNPTYDIWKGVVEERKTAAQGKKSDINLSKDVKKSVQSIVEESEIDEKLAKEIKGLMVAAKDAKDMDKLKGIKELLQNNGVDIKSLALSGTDKLKKVKREIEAL